MNSEKGDTKRCVTIQTNVQKHQGRIHTYTRKKTQSDDTTHQQKKKADATEELPSSKSREEEASGQCHLLPAPSPASPQST